LTIRYAVTTVGMSWRRMLSLSFKCIMQSLRCFKGL